MWRMCQYLHGRVCMAEMAFYFNGGFHEPEQVVYVCAYQGAIYSQSRERCDEGPFTLWLQLRTHNVPG